MKEVFEKEGFILVKSVLSAKEVNNARLLIEEIFKKYISTNIHTRFLFSSEVLKLKNIYKHVFAPKIVTALKQILSENYYVLPDFQIHRNVFGYGKLNGWHVDSGSEIPAPYLRRRDYKFVKCGIYLQDNTVEWGGGIDILPKCHTFPIKTFSSKLDHKVKNWRDRRLLEKKSWTVPLNAGDFIAFDSRLPHTSTHAKNIEATTITNDCVTTEIPDQFKKYVIYWDSTNTEEFANLFLKNSERRGDQEARDGIKSNELFYSDYLRFHFPDDYEPDFVELVKKNLINVATLQKSDALQRAQVFNKINTR